MTTATFHGFPVTDFQFDLDELMGGYVSIIVWAQVTTDPYYGPEWREYFRSFRNTWAPNGPCFPVSIC